MYSEEFKDKIKKDLKQSLSSHRYTHVLGVAAAARELATRYGADADTAEVAGLLHDAAKQLPLKDMRRLAEKSFAALPQPVLDNGGLLHGYAAVTIAKETYGLTDPDLLNAIAHHTTGAEKMSKLEKIIFLADYIEVNRDFNGVEALRKAARESLDGAVLKGYDSTIGHLLEQDKPIFVGTVTNRNALLAQMQASEGKDA